METPFPSPVSSEFADTNWIDWRRRKTAAARLPRALGKWLTGKFLFELDEKQCRQGASLKAAKSRCLQPSRDPPPGRNTLTSPFPKKQGRKHWFYRPAKLPGSSGREG